MCRLPKATGRSVQSLCPWAVCNDSINNVGSRGPSRLWRRKPTKGLGGKEPNMLIIGCDYHPGFQQIAFVDTETGECGERRLTHREEAEQFYRKLRSLKSCPSSGRKTSFRSGALLPINPSIIPNKSAVRKIQLTGLRVLRDLFQQVLRPSFRGS